MTDDDHLAIRHRILNTEFRVAKLQAQLREHAETSEDDEYGEFAGAAEQLMHQLEIFERHLESLRAVERTMRKYDG